MSFEKQQFNLHKDFWQIFYRNWFWSCGLIHKLVYDWLVLHEHRNWFITKIFCKNTYELIHKLIQVRSFLKYSNWKFRFWPNWFGNWFESFWKERWINLHINSSPSIKLHEPILKSIWIWSNSRSSLRNVNFYWYSYMNRFKNQF